MVEKAPDGSRHDGDREEAPSVGEVILPAARENFSEEGTRSHELSFKSSNVLIDRLEKSAVCRKIDWRIMPLAAWSCGLQFVDKVCGLESTERVHSLT